VGSIPTIAIHERLIEKLIEKWTEKFVKIF